MGLATYNEKRDFNQTPEPKGEQVKRSSALRFVVQRHQATKLHYDFRLEMEGVLKSWAVPKGPSMNPADKRLAVEVEDHPLAYGSFEGDIPEGHYGAGHVDIWDQGTYHAAETDDPKQGEELLLQGLKQGSISFVLQGAKLKGEFTLVKMKGRQKDAWLLIKKKDGAAVEDAYDSEEHLEGIKQRASQKPTKNVANTKEKGKASPDKLLGNGDHGTPSSDKSHEKSRIETEIEGQKVTLSSLDKFYWPVEQITKGDLIEYYQSMAEVLLPYLQDRPQSLFRYPNGITKPGFVQKDVPHTPDWVRTVKLKAESTGEEVEYLVVDNKATLAYMNNLGCIQLNPWNSRLANLAKPDYMVLDLDPGGNPYDEVIEVALAAKEVLDKAEAKAYVKTSGATGMHIFVPLGAKYSFEQAKLFAHIVAQLVHHQLPKLTSLERSPAKRRGKVYLDYLQNAIGQTVASAYTARPVPGATVSTPLDWKEVRPGLKPEDFSIRNIPNRVQEQGDLFRGVLGEGVNLANSLEKLNQEP